MGHQTTANVCWPFPYNQVVSRHIVYYILNQAADRAVGRFTIHQGFPTPITHLFDFFS
uniref:Glycosyltransferase n=1 Tax=Rhizophora mucronata TaxID=61149 RepID=A0A2P2PXR2_RHIMU